MKTFIQLFTLCLLLQSCDLIYDTILRPKPSKNDLKLNGKFSSSTINDISFDISGIYIVDRNSDEKRGFYKFYENGDVLGGIATMSNAKVDDINIIYKGVYEIKKDTIIVELVAQITGKRYLRYFKYKENSLIFFGHSDFNRSNQNYFPMGYVDNLTLKFAKIRSSELELENIW